MQCVAVGSTNPVKLEAARQAFAELFTSEIEVWPITTAGLEAQPWGEQATQDGAMHRARAALAQAAECTWGIGLEGGLVRETEEVLVTSWIAALRADGAHSLVRTAAFYLPPAVARVVLQGGTLAEAWAQTQGVEAIGRGGGTVGLLTGGRLDRTRLYREAVLLAAAMAQTQDAP